MEGPSSPPPIPLQEHGDDNSNNNNNVFNTSRPLSPKRTSAPTELSELQFQAHLIMELLNFPQSSCVTGTSSTVDGKHLKEKVYSYFLKILVQSEEEQQEQEKEQESSSAAAANNEETSATSSTTKNKLHTQLQRLTETFWLNKNNGKEFLEVFKQVFSDSPSFSFSNEELLLLEQQPQILSLENWGNVILSFEIPKFLYEIFGIHHYYHPKNKKHHQHRYQQHHHQHQDRQETMSDSFLESLVTIKPHTPQSAILFLHKFLLPSIERCFASLDILDIEKIVFKIVELEGLVADHAVGIRCWCDCISAVCGSATRQAILTNKTDRLQLVRRMLATEQMLNCCIRIYPRDFYGINNNNNNNNNESNNTENRFTPQQEQQHKEELSQSISSWCTMIHQINSARPSFAPIFSFSSASSIERRSLSPLRAKLFQTSSNFFVDATATNEPTTTQEEDEKHQDQYDEDEEEINAAAAAAGQQEEEKEDQDNLAAELEASTDPFSPHRPNTTTGASPVLPSEAGEENAPGSQKEDETETEDENENIDEKEKISAEEKKEQKQLEVEEKKLQQQLHSIGSPLTIVADQNNKISNNNNNNENANICCCNAVSSNSSASFQKQQKLLKLDPGFSRLLEDIKAHYGTSQGLRNCFISVGNLIHDSFNVRLWCRAVISVINGVKYHEAKNCYASSHAFRNIFLEIRHELDGDGEQDSKWWILLCYLLANSTMSHAKLFVTHETMTALSYRKWSAMNSSVYEYWHHAMERVKTVRDRQREDGDVPSGACCGGGGCCVIC